MLFTDSDLVTAADLAAIDGEVTKIAADPNSGVTTTGENSSITEAWKLCRAKMEAALQLFTTLYGTSGQQAHLTAVFNTGWSQPGTRARIRLNQIVAHDAFYSSSRSAIQGWVLYESLAHFYRNIATRYVPRAGGQGVEDRYIQKVKRYIELANFYWRAICNSGIPFVQSVFDCPGAKHAFNAGVWSASSLSLAVGGTSIAPQTVNVAITYYDAASYVSPIDKGNAESGPSAILPFTISAGHVLKVNISALNPPDGVNADPVGFSQGPVPIHTATHWNLYVGPANSAVALGNPLYLQISDIPIATKQAQLVDSPVFGGIPTLQWGQYPDPGSNLLFAHIVKRS